MTPGGRPLTIALVPARGGSKQVPRKNIHPLGGRPLLEWTIAIALASRHIERVLVSTDDEEIAAVARSAGAEVPFLRPSDLALDDTADLPVCAHALDWLQEHEGVVPEIVVWLRPTSPLRSVSDVDGAVDLLVATGADSVRTVCISENHPYLTRRLNGDRLVPFIDGIDASTYVRRQDLPPAYRLNGAVDVVWADRVASNTLLFEGDMRGYVMPVERSVDIDSELDFALAELLLAGNPNER
jgi:CMP-N,N'-diacetyllegionaminic acid synthase